MAENEAVFPIRYPTDTSGISKGVTELERLRAALQEDQKQIAGLQKAMASLKLDPDVQAFQRMQDELKKLGAEEEKAAKKFKDLTAQRDKLVAEGGDDKKIAELEKKRAEAFAGGKNIQSRMQGVKKALGELETKPAVQQFKDLGIALKDSEGKLAANQSKYLALGGDMTKMGDKVKSGFEKFSEGADLAGGGIGGMKQKFEALKALGPAGIIAAIVITIVALGVAAAKTAYDLTAFAIAAGDAARSTALLFEAAGGSKTAGEEMGGMVRRLRRDFAGSREEIAGMVLELRRAEIQGSDLESAVRLIGIETKTMGEGAAGILKGFIDRAKLTKRLTLNPFDLKGTGLEFNAVAKEISKLTGRTIGTVKNALINGTVKLSDGIKGLEAAVKTRFGDIAKRQLLALPEQANRARENLKNIFAEVKVDKFLEGLSKVLGLLDETTVTGRQLRAMAKDIFQPIVDFVGSDILPKVRIFFIGMSIAILDVVNVSLKAYIWFKKTFGDVGLFKGVDGAELAFKAGKIAVYALIGGVVLLGSVFATLGSMVAMVTAPIWALPALVSGVIASVMALKNKVASIMGAGNSSAVDAGNDAAKGAAQGVKEGAPAFNAAMKDLAKGGKEAFETELKIASPSKEMAKTSEIGIGGGVVKGVDASRDAVSDAMSRLVTPDDVVPTQGAAIALPGSHGGGDINIRIAQITVQGNGQGGIDKPSFVQQLVEIAEDVRRQLAMRTA